MAPNADRDTILAHLERPFLDLVFEAQRVHREHFEPGAVQVSSLLSVKTGGCPEDCGYCSQAARYQTGIEREGLLSTDEVISHARAAKEAGASRFCLSAAWRGPSDRDLASVAEMVAEVKSLGMETCATLGMLKEQQAEALSEAGLDYYNHNVDTSPEHYDEVISTRSYQDRLDTLERVQEAGIKVCSGGILGLGETRADRAGMLAELAAMDPAPDSVPINNLVRIPGTPLEEGEPVEPVELVRTIAAARLALPDSYIRLAAGRKELTDAEQALCFLAGANSVFYGDELLTTPNPEPGTDQDLFAKLGLTMEETAGDSKRSTGASHPA
jgi:biotin synthase